MSTVLDVAAFIERELGPLPALKLQKLVYYAQAWSIAWDGSPLFSHVIKAWKNGPVSPQLWHDRQQGLKGNANALTSSQAATVSAVLAFYGPLDANTLIELSHRETPWRDARAGLPKSAPGKAAITPAAMRAYYGPLAKSGEKRVPAAIARGIDLLMSVSDDESAEIFEDDDVEAAEAMAWLEKGGADPWHGTSG